MGDRSAIEWTDATWNPVRGCARVSTGCEHCYAERVAARFSGIGQPYAGLIHPHTHGWNGKIKLVPEMLDQPLRWKRPRRIFVNSMSDLFHENVPDDFIDRVFAVMALAPQHMFQVLTKRPDRMRNYLFDPLRNTAIKMAAERLLGESDDRGDDRASLRIIDAWPDDFELPQLPLQNVWLGVSVENQATADERIPLLLHSPAAVHFLSCEPLLGPISLDAWPIYGPEREQLLNWIIVGGESGVGARPMHPDWARSLRDQCAAARVPFFFKQWGEWAIHRAVPGGDEGGDLRRGFVRYVQGDCRDPDGHFRKGDAAMARVGKKRSGRLLDGREHNAFPELCA